MIRPKLQRVTSGTRLTTDLVNAIINRTEYAADILRQYKLIAGNQMYVEPHYDGTRVSYFQPVAGGATPAVPIPAYDTVMVLDKVYDFPENFKFNTDASGFVPLNKRTRLIIPQFALNEPQNYAIRSIGYYWANLSSPPDANGKYPAWASSFYITITIFNFGGFAFGPHPPAPNTFTGEPSNYWYGGSAYLVRLN